MSNLGKSQKSHYYLALKYKSNPKKKIESVYHQVVFNTQKFEKRVLSAKEKQQIFLMAKKNYD